MFGLAKCYKGLFEKLSFRLCVRHINIRWGKILPSVTDCFFPHIVPTLKSVSGELVAVDAVLKQEW